MESSFESEEEEGAPVKSRPKLEVTNLIVAASSTQCFWTFSV